MIKTLLVTLVVSISALAPIAGAQVNVKREPLVGVVVDNEVPSNAVVMKLLQDQDQPAVAGDLKDIPLPQPKPAANDNEVPKTAIAIGPALDTLVALAGLLATLISGLWAWVKVKLFKANMDEKHKAALHDAAQNGVLWAAAKIREKLGDHPSIDVKSEMLAAIGTYLIATVPDALKWFKFDMSDKSEYEDIATANAAKLGIDLTTAKAA